MNLCQLMLALTVCVATAFAESGGIPSGANPYGAAPATPKKDTIEVFDNRVFQGLGEPAPIPQRDKSGREIDENVDKGSREERGKAWADCANSSDQRACYNAKREQSRQDLEQRRNSGGGRGINPNEVAGGKKKSDADF